jgi:hypothetical protein
LRRIETPRKRQKSREREIDLKPIPKPKQKYNEKRELIRKVSPVKNANVRPGGEESGDLGTGKKKKFVGKSNLEIDEMSGKTTTVDGAENTFEGKRSFLAEVVQGEYVSLFAWIF